MPWLPEARWFWRSSVPSPATQAPSLVGYSRSFLPNRIPDFASLKIDISSTYSDPMASRTFVADCDTRDFTDQKREDMLVSDFVRLCFKYEGSAVQCSNQIGVSNGDSASVPYLKDWHFVK
ncbi:hypothetical protein RYX36_009050, partial [Vicia faba]